MQIDWESDALDLCKKLFDFVCAEYDCLSCKGDTVCSLKEQFHRVTTRNKDDYGTTASDLLNQLDEQNKRLGSVFSTRIPSSAESSHGWKLSQADPESRNVFNTSREAIASLIDDLKEL